MGVLLWALSAASPISQPTSDRAALERELGRARAKWNGRRPANYEFVLSVPRNVTWWEREFGIYRVTGETVTAVKPLTGPPAPLFKDHTTIDALFDLVAGRISTSPSSTSPSYEQEVGYVRGFYSRDRPDISFDVPVWRAFSDSADLREPFALIQHVNHCAFFREPTDTRQCPTYAIAIWGDGTVVYDGDSGVRTLGRRQHQVGQDAVRDLSSAISTSGFFTSAGEEYHSVATASGMMTTINIPLRNGSRFVPMGSTRPCTISTARLTPSKCSRQPSSGLLTAAGIPDARRTRAVKSPSNHRVACIVT